MRPGLVRNAVDPGGLNIEIEMSGCLQQQTEIAIQAFGQPGLTQMVNYHVDLGKPL
jgi:hypothetical protein